MKNKIIHVAIDSLPQSSSNWIEILSSSLTPIIAIIALYIAIQQYKTNKQRLRYELYEKRLAIYNVVKMHLSKVAREGTITTPDCIEFYHNASEADFLFDKTITDKIEEIFEKSIELSATVDDMLQPVGGKRTNIARVKEDLMVWHFNQLEEIKKEFTKQIGIKKT